MSLISRFEEIDKLVDGLGAEIERSSGADADLHAVYAVGSGLSALHNSLDAAYVEVDGLDRYLREQARVK